MVEEVDKRSTADKIYAYDDEFRDTLTTVDAKGKRVWLYPKKPSGALNRWRFGVSMFLLALLFAGPFVTYDGRPFLLFNFFERKFILFGNVFWPQDFFLLALTLITFFVFVILFTVAFGRLWCGWACPQTLFMEMVFRKIEYLIEGDAKDQRKLAQMPWNAEKIIKKSSKQIIFFAIALLIAHIVMAYLISWPEVVRIVSEPPSAHLAGFIGLMVFTGIFYGVFAFFREQACIAVCPYGRLQSVLLVKDSIVVAYDWIRGEPRGKIKKNAAPTDPKTGDCIDCKLCVHVCPTGIDIRNGTQLECVNCTACIDACDDVMVKVNKPTGLIRYSSHKAIAEGRQKLITPRVIGYSVVLVALLSLLTYFLSTRKDVETTMLKAPGTLYTRTDDNRISNLYNIEFVNKTFEDIRLEVRIESPANAEIKKIGESKDILVPKDAIVKNLYMIYLPESAITSSKTIVEVGIYQNGKKIQNIKSKFLGPIHSKTSN